MQPERIQAAPVKGEFKIVANNDTPRVYQQQQQNFGCPEVQAIKAQQQRLQHGGSL